MSKNPFRCTGVFLISDARWGLTSIPRSCVLTATQHVLEKRAVYLAVGSCAKTQSAPCVATTTLRAKVAAEAGMLSRLADGERLCAHLRDRSHPKESVCPVSPRRPSQTRLRCHCCYCCCCRRHTSTNQHLMFSTKNAHAGWLTHKCEKPMYAKQTQIPLERGSMVRERGGRREQRPPFRLE